MTLTTTIPHDDPHPSPRRPRQFVTRAAASTTAALVAVTVLFLAAPAITAEAPGAGGSTGELVSLFDVLMATVVGSLGAVVLAAVLRRFSRRPRATFLVVCAVSLTLYGLLPVMAAETVDSAIWLNVLHLGVAAPLVAGLLPCLPRRGARSRTQDLPTDVGNTLQR
jgi:hypothetical protein